MRTKIGGAIPLRANWLIQI